MWAIQLTRATQAAVHSVAHAYGFQQLSLGTDQAWVTSTAGLAADQLVALLRDAAGRRSAVYSSQGQQQPLDEASISDWESAICDVHAEYQEEYQRWLRKLCLPHPELQQAQHEDEKSQNKWRRQQQQMPQEQRVAQRLLELSLQFCIYTEAANLRHTPHLLFLLYYLARGSSKFTEVLTSFVALPPNYQPGQLLPHAHWLFWAKLPVEDFPAAAIFAALSANQQQQQPPVSATAGACDVNLLKRSLVQQLYDAVPGAFRSAAAVASAGQEGSAAAQQSGLQAAANTIINRVLQSSRDHKHVAWVEELLKQFTQPGWRQQQETYLRLVVQPLFFFLAEQIDLAGQQAEEEPALRIAYDDVNEHCCSPSSVYRLLKVLKLQYKANPAATDLWQALLQILGPQSRPAEPPPPAPVWKRLFGGKKAELPDDVRGRYPRDIKRLELLNQLSQLAPTGAAAADSAAALDAAASPAAGQFTSTLTLSKEPVLDTEATPMHEVYLLAKRGADWWADNMFRHKTYVEARSAANPFIAFWRVYAFHAALLTAMAALAYVWHERDASAPVPWLRLLAALLLSTVTDALMRVLRAGAHLLLLSYRVPVKRKVGGKWKALNPFPPGGFSIALGKVLVMLLWLAWTAVLAFAVIPVLIAAPLSFSASLELWLHKRLLWLIPAIAHAVVIWGHALLCQRPGYTTSLFHNLAAKFACSTQHNPEGLKAALSGASKTGARAYCAADSGIDALFFPASNLVVDKGRWLRNAALWVLVLVLKVVFELPLVVYPLVSLMSQLVKSPGSYLGGALESNNPVVAAVGHATTLVALAVPIILLSFSDTGLIFSVVGAAASVLEGFWRGVGSIKTWAQMVSRFEALLQCYQQHCVSRSAVQLHLHSADEASMQEVSMSAVAAGWNALVLDLRERDLLDNRELASLTFEHLQLTHSQKAHLRDLPHVEHLGLTSVLPARCFMTGSVPELASGHVGSAHHLWVGRMVWGWLLWVFWQTGLLYDDNKTMGATREETLRLLADREREAIANLQHLTNLRLLHPPRTRQQIQRWQELLSQTVELLKLLSCTNSIPSNEAAAAAAVVQARGLQPGKSEVQLAGLLHGVPDSDKQMREKWRALSGHVHRLLVLLDKELHAVERLVQTQTRGGGSAASLFVATLCGHREADITPDEYKKAREALSGLRTRWQQLASNATLEAASSPTQRFNMTTQQFLNTQEEMRVQVLQHIAQVGQASDGPAQVVRWLTDVLTMYAGDTVPADEEAVRFILSFASSLSDPGLGVAPSIAAMPSLTTLVPHYDEDVLYALSQDDALKDLGRDASKLTADSMKKMAYLMTPVGSATDTLSYLRSVYNEPGQPCTQWANFVERVKDLAAAQGISPPQTVNEYHFLPGGPLHPLKQELLLWASWRGQLLARTVRGLMSYRTALQALARHENPHLMPAQQQQQLDALAENHHKLQKLLEQMQHQHQQLVSGSTQPGQQQQQQHEASRIQQRMTYVQQKLSTVSQALAPLQQQSQQREALRDVLLDDLVDCKYQLVVSSQNFGVFASKESASNMKAAWLVHSIHQLRERHPTLKIAFIDKQRLLTASRPGQKLELFRNASVLLASTHQQRLAAAAGLPVTQEAYRVLLPVNFESARGVVLGEGKPENQNHAIVFCPGEALQTIDCNQDNIVAEGLKLRNLLAELLPEGWDTSHLQSRPTVNQMLRQTTQRWLGLGGAAAGAPSDNAQLLKQIPQGKGRVALVGFREWIFSEDSGALAEFAAATERSFGTTIQRLMYNPGAVRFHYGHPDVWRRSFVSTCGGVSKANKGIHVSEDVFGGYNVILRGREIKYVDYIAVGKGRDMSFETVLTFEAKIAAGNGEQVLSRDVRRLGHNMDFTRLMTWYHTGNGFFINTAITMLSVHASLWAYLLLALGKYSNPEVQQYLSAIQVLQLGTLSVLVYLFTLALETGIVASLFTIVRQVVQGSLMFYIFRAQTSAYSFTYDLLFGGAKYLATGRGYKLAPTSFKDLYRRFGRSHFYFGAVLLQYAVACVSAGHLSGTKLFVLWAQLLVVFSLLFGPFWFTPFAFRTTSVLDDFNGLQQWLMSPSPQPEHSWQSWNAEFWRAAADASGKQMGRLGACVCAHLSKLPTLVLVLASVARMKSAPDNKLPKWAVALILAGGVLWTVSIILVSRLVAARTALKSQIPRVLNLLATVLLAGGIAVSGWATSGQSFTTLDTYSNVFLVFFGTILLLRLLPLVFYSVLGSFEVFKDLANAVYYLADVILLYFLNCMRFVLSLFDILTGIQAQLLFNTAFARQVMAEFELANSKLPELITEALVLKRKQQADVKQQ